jgi:hypothetical protein
MTTFGERAEELLRRPSIAPAADEFVRRLASVLDPTDTDEGAERVEALLRERLRSAVADAAVRHRWRLP